MIRLLRVLFQWGRCAFCRRWGGLVEMAPDPRCRLCRFQHRALVLRLTGLP